MPVIPELGGGGSLGFVSLIGGLQANMHAHSHTHACTPTRPPAHMHAHATRLTQHLIAPSMEHATDTIYSEASW